MANTQDRFLAIVCVVLLIISLGYFYITTSVEEETEYNAILSATMEYAIDTDKYIK